MQIAGERSGVAGVGAASLRKATAADVPALRAVHRASLNGLARSHYSATQIAALLRHVPTLDETLISDRTYFVAEVDGRIAACGGWSTRTPGYQPALGERAGVAAGQGAVLIRAMYTHPDWARRGLARRILAAAESEACQVQERTIELDALLPGVPLYLAAGYEALDERALVLPGGEPMQVVRMRKRPRQPARKRFGWPARPLRAEGTPMS